MTKIVLDCYGGDNAPEEIVKGALDALDNDSDLSLVLTGKEDVLKTLVTRNSDRIEIIDAQDVVTNDDVPTDAIRKKTESSMVKAFDALKNRDDIGGIVSAGSTGALLTGAFLKIGRIKGISRPAMAALESPRVIARSTSSSRSVNSTLLTRPSCTRSGLEACRRKLGQA